MSEPFVAEIRIFGFNFAPKGWAFCDGQLLPIAQNTALFSLLGTTYGGNGQTTFALPDLQDRSPMQPGQGPGLTDRFEGETSGAETVTLATAEIPSHTHGLGASNTPGDTPIAVGDTLARATGAYQSNAAQNLVQMHAQGLASAGGGQPHDNRQPYLVLNFCIALQGVFPPRS